MSRNSRELVLLLFLGFIVVASGADFYADLSHGAPMQHIIKEAGIVLVSVVCIVWIVMGLRQQALEIERLKIDLADAGQSLRQPDAYVIDARKKLGEVISRQFVDWELTASEQEVGLLLLKGLSLREIATVRNTLEKTVRQQASAIYKKAGISGRHAFSAWFIEDIL